jgi:hypothetical protein
VGKVFNFRAVGVVQVIGCLPSKCEAPSLNHCITKIFLTLVSEKQTLKTNKLFIFLTGAKYKEIKCDMNTIEIGV